MNLEDYKPHSRLETRETQVLKPRFPVIDAHNHLDDDFGGGWINRPLNQLLDRLDEANVLHYVDLDGGWGEAIYEKHVRILGSQIPARFSVFGGLDWPKWAQEGNKFGEQSARRLETQCKAGMAGLKVWKNFGLDVRDQQNDLVSVDDERLDPVWETAASFKLPVLIHIADPVAFFDPLDANNERWEELKAHPDWHFPSPTFPTFSKIINAFAKLVKRHPNTTFIGAHVGCYSENLDWVSDLLDACPNFHVDFSARISELGRQPYRARKFFLEHADRILFGTDMGPDLEAYHIYYRFLETWDEYFNYSPAEIPPQGRWRISGLGLPDDVLEKVYYLNARRVIQRDTL
jgi:Amidohydrolase